MSSHYNSEIRLEAVPDLSRFGSVFSPSDISGLQLWLDADDSNTITLNSTNGSTVSQWDDKSGNNYHVSQSDDSSQPTYVESVLNSKNIVRFDGADKLINGSATPAGGSTNRTVFVVFNRTSPLNDIGYPLTLGISSSTGQTFGISQEIAVRTGNSSRVFTTAVDSTHAIVTVALNGTSTTDLSARKNGSTLCVDSTSQSILNTASGIILGQNTANSGPHYGDVAEIIVYDSALSTSDIQSVESYLASKWGIALNTFNSEIRLEVASDLSIFEAENNLSITKSAGVTGTNSANNTVEFSDYDYLYFPDVACFAGSDDDFIFTGEVSFDDLSGNSIHPIFLSFYSELYIQVETINSTTKRFKVESTVFPTAYITSINVNTTETYQFRLERSCNTLTFEVVPSVSASDSVSIDLSSSTLELTGGDHPTTGFRLGRHPGLIYEFDGTISNFVAKTTKSNILSDCEDTTNPITTTTTTTTSTTTSPTTTTTTIPPVTCAALVCLRGDGRGQRSNLRQTPFISSFVAEEIVTTTTTTTTTSTTIDPVLLGLVSYPSDAECPYITTTVPPMYFDASGGDSFSIYGGGKAHIFTSNGTFCITPYYESEFEYATIEYLIIGGGGAGGNNEAGGGGGGGQVKTGTIKLESGCFEVVIGAGGGLGNDGSPSSVAGVVAIGGGGGGSVYFDGRDGANGGGGGGKGTGGASLLVNGYYGGTSLNYKLGAGGGGAGGYGGFVSSNATKPGIGGAGKASDIVDGSVSYYGGGGAGGAKDGTQQVGGVGGGGSTLNKDAVDGTGGGGAAKGYGGDGLCVLYYKFSTTTTTTTTLVPTDGPDAPDNLQAEGTDPYSVTISWTPVTETGDCPDVEKYVINYTYDDANFSTLEFNMLSSNLLQYDEDNNKFYYEISELEVDDPYTFYVLGYNSCDLEGSSSSVTFQHVTTTTTTTTTLPPENLTEFRFNFLDNIINGVIEQSSIIYTGEQGSTDNVLTANFKAADTVPDDYVFIENPSLVLEGGDVQYIRNLDIIMDSNRSGRVVVNFVMPESNNAIVNIGVYGTVGENTVTTTTTTTTTTLPPFCPSIYDGLRDGITEAETPSTDYKVRPLQVFISKEPFPHQLTGTSLTDGTDSGRPWYNGELFEQSRVPLDGQDYIDNLPDDHNISIPYRDIFGINKDHTNLIYKLFYPSVFNRQIFLAYNEIIPSEVLGSYSLSYSINLDFICNVENQNQFGLGDDVIEGFIKIEFTETDGTVTNTIHTTNVRSIDERFIGTFNSLMKGREYHFMVDFGSEYIRGKL